MANQQTLNSLGIRDLLRNWGNRNGIHLYDFDQDVFAVPVCAPNGSYLTSCICILCRPGKGPIENGRMFPRACDGILNMGNGWYVLAVEFNNTMTPAQLNDELTKAHQKLFDHIKEKETRINAGTL
jgi:hypothetical protein